MIVANEVERTLESMGLAMPEAPTPIASYVPAARAGSLIVVSGQLPFADGELLACGPVPSTVSEAEVKTAARQALLNALAVVKAELGGDWTKLKRIVRMGMFVRSDGDFAGQSAVANGASELLVELFGEAGRHARAAIGVNALPLGAAVEVELMVEVE